MGLPAQNLTKACRDVFVAHGWVTFKCGAGMIRSERRMIVYGTAGAPDFVAVKGQMYILCEVKAGRDVQSPAQLAFQADVERVFGNYLILRSVADVTAALKERGLA